MVRRFFRYRSSGNPGQKRIKNWEAPWYNRKEVCKKLLHAPPNQGVGNVSFCIPALERNFLCPMSKAPFRKKPATAVALTVPKGFTTPAP